MASRKFRNEFETEKILQKSYTKGKSRTSRIVNMTSRP